MDLLITGRLTHGSTLRLPTAGQTQCTIDARQLEFVEPAGLIQLVLAVRYIAATVSLVRFIAPDNINVDSYLARMDFYEYLPSTVQVIGTAHQMALQKHDRRDVLIALRHLNTSDDEEEAMDQIYEYLSRQDLPTGMPAAIHFLLSELCDNAVTHGRSSHGCYLAAQTYRNHRHIAVGDLGIGIRAHLKGNDKYANVVTDEEAIQLAVRGGVTGAREPRGYGLYDIQQELGKLQGQTGRARLLIRSGLGYGSIWIEGDVRRPHFYPSKQAIQGTLVEVLVLS
jgi:anti-sigma regulatory factor (Ser/Thr protein kinase)